MIILLLLIYIEKQLIKFFYKKTSVIKIHFLFLWNEI